jgi:MFS family permease
VTIPALVAVNFVFATFGQLVNVTVMAVRQAVTPDGMQGRAAATITFAGMGLTPLGSLLGGFLGQEWGLRAGLLVTAAGMMLSPALMASSPLARLGRTLPALPTGTCQTRWNIRRQKCGLLRPPVTRWSVVAG